MRAAFTPAAGAPEWPRTKLWMGIFCENIVQGSAASLLQDKLREADKLDLPVVLSVHDEIVIESSSKNDAEVLRLLMNTAPTWCADLPLKAEVVEMDVYGK